ncbi:MAG: hypothetical protein JNM95_13715 [Chitinophagaceae bacterium]|nr:hypothetical protein [Chitinophagaceae bacterium]
MKNYAEEIAYLYFRLNGFFLLENYITNKEEYTGRNHTDTDLLGIKTPYVTEEIGLNNINDIDTRLREIVHPDFYIGLICEVKGGEEANWQLAVDKMNPCVKRLGLIPPENTAEAVYSLDRTNQYTLSGSPIQIIKVLATDNTGLSADMGMLWNIIPLENMVNFIKDRMDRYDSKRNSWHFSHSTIFQYLLYEKRNRAH